jgi:hypothetical protein
MFVSFLEKVSISFVVISILTIMIILMFLDKNKVHNDILSIKYQILSVDDSLKVLSEIFFQIDGTYPKVQVDSFQEGLSLKGFTNAFKKGGQIENTFKKGGSIEKGLEDPLKKIKKFIEQVNEAFKVIPKRFGHLRRAFDKIGQGIRLQFKNLGKSLKIGFDDIFDLFDTLGKCGIKYVKNLRYCMIWYVLDLIGTTLYSVFVTLPVFMIRVLTGFNLQPFVDGINCIIRYIDGLYFKLTCYHFIHFPEWVIKDCYTCDCYTLGNTLNFRSLRLRALLGNPLIEFNPIGAPFLPKASFVSDLEKTIMTSGGVKIVWAPQGAGKTTTVHRSL